MTMTDTSVSSTPTVVHPRPLVPGDPALDVVDWFIRVVDELPAVGDTIEETMAFGFEQQLGRAWKAPKDEPFVWQAVIAILCGHAVGDDQKTALAHCRNFASRAATDDASVGFPRRYIVPASPPGSVRPMARFLVDTARVHHYSSTLVLDLLLTARARSGRLHSCEFTWVAKFDRQLWLILDAAGRPDLQPETAAIVSHCMDEKMLGKPLEKIHVGRLASEAAMDFDRARRRD
jgi:hypothetical protein